MQWNMLNLVAAVLTLLPARAAGQQALSPLVLTVAVEDSSTYRLYRYQAENPAASTWSVARFGFDLSSSVSGAGGLLETTGRYWETRSLASAPLIPHPPVGPITPIDWEASISGQAELSWWGINGGAFDYDSIAPESTLGGFGLRSPSLPGLRQAYSRPTNQVCCFDLAEPVEDNPDLRVPSPSEFEVSSWTVGPRYGPGEVDLSLLETQVTAVCTDPLWINNPTLCTEMSDSLTRAEARLAINNYQGAAVATKGVGNLADNNRAIWGGPVQDNAYWLLRINSTHVADEMMTGQPPIAYVDLCTKGPEGTTIDFTLTASGGYLMQSSPLHLETAQDGDPPHTGCSSIWRIDWGDEAIVDLTIVADSITPGHEVGQIWLLGGLDGDTTYIGQDSITTRHDGVTGAWMVWELVPSPF